MKIYTHFFSFTQFDSMQPIQLFKIFVYKCIGYLHENDQAQAYAVV